MLAAAILTDNAVVRGDGGGHGIQTSTVLIADNGVLTVPALGTGAITAYDLLVGNVTTPNYGMVRIGDSRFGRTSFNAGNIDLDGAILISNLGGPVTGNIEIIFTESSGNTCRFAIPSSGVGLATYNPRSMLIAGPAPADTDFVKVSYWQGQDIFHNLLCDTSGFGADLGVQWNCEIENFLFVDVIKESRAGVGVAVDGLLLLDTTLRNVTQLRGSTYPILDIAQPGGILTQYLRVTGATAGNNPSLTAVGPAGDVDLEITAQGATGQVIIGPVGDIVLGVSGTPIQMYPDGSEDVTLGTATKPFGDARFEGFYGEMHADNQSILVTIAVVNTHVEIPSGFTGGLVNGFAFQNAKELKCTAVGRYKLVWSISGQSASANQEFEGSVMLNGTAQTKGSGHSTMVSANKTASLGGTLLLDLAVDDLISLSMANHTGTANFTMEHASLVAERVGN